VPNFQIREQPYKPPKIIQLDWNTFTGGLNTLLRQTEIKDKELAQADNLKLVGSGVPTKRDGTGDYFLTAPSVATGSQRVRGLKGVLFASGASGVNELLALSDWGLLVKKSGASYSIIYGASYSSGYNADIVQAFNNVYITNGVDNLTKYNGASILSFTQLSRPTGLLATNLSGVTGTFERSFRISAFNNVGETIASDAVLINYMPQDPIDTTVRLTWTTSSPASSVIGYGVYGYDQGDERLITTIDPSSKQYDYKGVPDPSNLVFPAGADTTLGPIAKYTIIHKDKIILGNIDSYPSRIAWSGGGSNIDKFNWRYGGGYIDIDKDSGDVVKGLIEFQDKIIVFKERSIWEVSLATEGSIVVPTVKMIVRGVGTVSHKTVKYVENDVFFLSRKGVFTLGNEANYLNVLRTNELSSRIRSIFSLLSSTQLDKACAVYQDNKYRLAFPVGASDVNTKEVIYDRERLCWMGPNTFPAAPGVYEVYYDGAGKENLLWGDSNDNFVTEYSDGYPNDKGVKIQTALLTKKTAFKNPFRFKMIRNIYSNWRNIFGTPFVNIILETRDGALGSAESFTISASNAGVGWGFDNFGTTRFGTSGGMGSGTSSNDLAKQTRINKVGRTVQIEITTTGNNDKYELLALQLQAQELGEGITPSQWRTN
jgi:hypothetical protein